MAVALDLDELEQRWQYILANGDPKEWKWSSPDKAGTASILRGAISGKEVMNKVSTALRIPKQAIPKDKNIREFFERRPSEYKPIKRYTYPDGRIEYRDESENIIELPEGTSFVKVD